MNDKYTNIHGDRPQINETMAEFEKIHENSMAQLYKLDLHDDKVKLMISQEKPMTQQPLNVQKLMKNSVLGKVPSTTTGREFYDMLAEHFVEITGGEGARKMASLYLLENGVPGMSYLDDVTRTDWKINDGLLTQQGEKKISHTVFDNSSYTMLERQGQDVIKDKMIAQHVLSQEALKKHLEYTGIPMPSIATTKADNPLTHFGEISLLPDVSMITPSRITKTYPVDMYSGRAPYDQLVYKDVNAVLDSIDPEVLRFHANVKPIDDPEAMTTYNTKMNKGQLLEGKVKGKLKLKENHTGILEAQMKMVDQMIELGYDPYKYPTFREARFEIDNDLRAKRGYPLMPIPSEHIPKNELLGETVRTMANPKGVFTELGNRRPDVPYSAEDALKVMRRDKAYLPGAENFKTVNQTIALASAPFKNLDEIKKNRGLLEDATGTGYGDAKEVFELELEIVQDKLTKLGNKDGKRLPMVMDGQRDNLIDDVLRSGRITAEDIAYMKYTPEQAKEAEKLILSLKDKNVKEDDIAKAGLLVTDYFESKPNKIVDIAEFKGAIIPKETKETIIQLLKDKGIMKIFKYGDEAERIKLFRKFPELMFVGIAIPTGGLLSTQDNEEGKLSGGLLK